MGFQLLRGSHLYEEFPQREMEPTALPRELIRCWEETYTENGKRKTRGISLMRPCDVPQFRTEFLSECTDLYNNWRLFDKTPPCGQGWANERGVTCRILHILEVENNKYDAWERDKEKDRKR